MVLLPPMQVALTDRDCKVFAGMGFPVFLACAGMPTVLICDVSLRARVLLHWLHVSTLSCLLGAALAPECIHHTCPSSLTTLWHPASPPPSTAFVRATTAGATPAAGAPLATAKLLPTAPFGPHQPLACLSVPYKCDTLLQLWRPPCEACCGDSCGSLHPVSQHLEFASSVAV